MSMGSSQEEENDSCLGYDRLFFVVANGSVKMWFYGGKHGDVFPFVFSRRGVVRDRDIEELIQLLSNVKRYLQSIELLRREFIVRKYREAKNLKSKKQKAEKRNEELKYIKWLINDYMSEVLERLILIQMYLETLQRTRAQRKTEECVFTKKWILSLVPEEIKAILEELDREELEKVAYLSSRAFLLSNDIFIELYRDGKDRSLVVFVRFPFVMSRVILGEKVLFEFYCATNVDFEEYALRTVERILRKYGELFGITRIEIDRKNRVFTVS